MSNGLLPRVVMAFEAFSAEPYDDAGDRPTVGYGHVIRPHESFTSPLTRDQGVALLEQDLGIAARNVDTLFPSVPLEAFERDALTCFTFNTGFGALRDSTLRQRVLAGNRRAAAGEFLRWVHMTKPSGEKVILPGLVRRRHCESVWFLGAHPATVAYLAGVKEAE